MAEITHTYEWFYRKGPFRDPRGGLEESRQAGALGVGKLIGTEQ